MGKCLPPCAIRLQRAVFIAISEICPVPNEKYSPVGMWMTFRTAKIELDIYDRMLRTASTSAMRCRRLVSTICWRRASRCLSSATVLSGNPRVLHGVQ